MTDARKPVDRVERLEEELALVRAAQKTYAEFTQEQVDRIFFAAAMAAGKMRLPLAKMAVEETGMGVVEDKVIKNHFASEYIYNAYRDVKTCGVIEEDKAYGITRLAEPLGVIAAVIPTTNPTSTAIFKTLACLKTRNGIIISPHPRARKCTVEAARIVLEAAVAAGAPEHIISWIDVPSLEMTNLIMCECDCTLATGGPGMVRSAYSSGKPAIGVGAGNGPAYIHRSADVAHALACIARSKSFDYGTVCASEQSIIVEKGMESAVRSEGERQGFFFMDTAQAGALAKLLFRPNGTLNPDIVGKPAALLLTALGVDWPVIVENYLITNERMAASTDCLLTAVVDYDLSEAEREVIRTFDRADAAFLTAARDAVAERYGSVDAFLTQALGVGAAERAALRARYLTAE